jgi:glycosyltransferase involved in cell wall biosynthesis
VIGGGERLALYIDEALRVAAAQSGTPLTTTLLALDGRRPVGGGKDRYQSVNGSAWDVYSLDADELTARLRPADAVYVHQCLTHVGLFAAAHARLLGKHVFGSDAGAGEAPLLAHNPDAMAIYDAVHAISVFAASAFEGFAVPVHVVPGPVDTTLHHPAPAGAPARDPSLVVSVGRILPHKGHERVIRALPAGMSLTIVGQHYDPAYLAYLQATAEGKPVSFADALDDAEVRALLHRAGVFVHASTHIDYLGRYAHKPELLGLAPLEALACGTPTLVSDAACLPELAVVPGCRVFRDEAELSAMLAEIACGRARQVPEADMHAAVTARFGLAEVGARLLSMMGIGQPCAS